MPTNGVYGCSSFEVFIQRVACHSNTQYHKLNPVNPDAFAKVTRLTNNSLSRLFSISHASRPPASRIFTSLCACLSLTSSAAASECKHTHGSWTAATDGIPSGELTM